ncbi:DUF6207 family protein [Streptomyces griseus]|uniref:DUF6207 family protein n=1 Tax=Streptomyces griseus TaxID=1911 RepID=UPI00381060DC
MDSVIDARHVSEPGLVVLDVTAADKGDRPALVDGLQQLWATSGITTTPLRPASTPGCTRTSGAPTPAAQLTTSCTVSGGKSSSGSSIMALWWGTRRAQRSSAIGGSRACRRL